MVATHLTTFLFLKIFNVTDLSYFIRVDLLCFRGVVRYISHLIQKDIKKLTKRNSDSIAKAIDLSSAVSVLNGNSWRELFSSELEGLHALCKAICIIMSFEWSIITTSTILNSLFKAIVLLVFARAILLEKEIKWECIKRQWLYRKMILKTKLLRRDLTLGCLCNYLTVVSIVTALRVQYDLYAHTEMLQFSNSII